MKNSLPQKQTIVDWALSILKADGSFVVDVEDVAATPYSCVVKLKTPVGIFFLKNTPPALFVERKILSMLKDFFPQAAVPVVTAANPDLCSFITGGCGDMTLRSLFAGDLKDGLNKELLSQGLREYRQIQDAMQSRVQDFLDIGTPDWRLARLPALYQALSDDALLSAGTRKSLRQLQSVFARLCDDGAACDIPDTLNHSDFQENNMVVDRASGKVSIIDWGEVTVGCPLLSVLGCFKKICRRYGLVAENPDYQTLLRTFLAGYPLPQSRLAETTTCFLTLYEIYYALTLAALVRQTGHPHPEWLKRMEMSCRSFIEKCNKEALS